MKKIGDFIDTDIELFITQNGQKQSVLLKELLKRPTVVTVYMKSNTSSCDIQNKSLATDYAKIKELGFDVISISKDTCTTQERYANKLNLPFLLVSDPEQQFSKSAGSFVEKKLYGKTYFGAQRSAFILSTKGEILGLIEKVSSKKHGEEIVALLETLS